MQIRNLMKKESNIEKTIQHSNVMNIESHSESDLSEALSHDLEYQNSLQKELSKVSFGVLLSAKNELDMSSSIRDRQQNKKIQNIKDQLKKTSEKNQKKTIEKKHSRKHAPLEMSSNKPVSKFRQVVPVTKIERRDPRFDFLENRVNLTNLNFKYSFIKDYHQEEIKLLKSTLNTEKNHKQKERLKKTIISMESKLMAAKNKEDALKVLREHKKIEKAKVEAGKTPFFLKKKEQKKLIEMDKLSKLKKTNALNKYLQRKDKKLASKERKRLPRYTRD